MRLHSIYRCMLICIMHTVVLAAFWAVTTQRTCKVKKKEEFIAWEAKNWEKAHKTIVWHLASECGCLKKKKKKKSSPQLLICNICGNALSIQNSYPISLLQVGQEHHLLILFYPFPMRGNPSIWTGDVLDCSCQLGKRASSTLPMQEMVCIQKWINWCTIVQSVSIFQPWRSSDHVILKIAVSSCCKQLKYKTYSYCTVYIMV